MTSQDINNTAISLSLKDYIQNEYLHKFTHIFTKINEKMINWKNVVFIGRTHGQSAVPTTMGKEIAVFDYRLQLQKEILTNISFYGKFGGACGNLNAHKCSYPNIDWINFGEKFLKSFGLIRSKLTTQIDNYDNLSVLFDCLKRIIAILIDFVRIFGCMFMDIYNLTNKKLVHQPCLKK